ncbi:hypothetical protein PMAYCL1PPCAC_01462, partial [Pristionchus mayeri]
STSQNPSAPSVKSHGEVDGKYNDFMSSNSKNLSASAINSHREVDGKDNNFFNILGLPNELITPIFSHLLPKDRLRARVNKRLLKVELETKYFIKKMIIGEFSPQFEERQSDNTINTAPSRRPYDLVVTIDGHSYSPDFIPRTTQNASIEYLRIELSGNDVSHREVYNRIKIIDVKMLDLRFQNDYFSREIIVDSFFLDIAKRIEVATIDKCLNITAEVFHQVYKGMIDGSCKLRNFHTYEVNKHQCNLFLQLIGISFADAKFRSNRDIEVYGFGFQCNSHYIYSSTNPIHFRIFDGKFEIFLNNFVFDGIEGEFGFVLHETEESLWEAKKPERYS